MTPTKLLAVAAIGLSAAACGYSSTTTATAPPPATVVVPAGTVVAANSSQQACIDYGLTPGTASYDRCVGREIDARRYRQEAVVTTYTPATPTFYPSSGTTVYTSTPFSTVAYAPAATTPPAGVQVFRDEYGFRYDVQGNRVDARGNIISPQSTRP